MMLTFIIGSFGRGFVLVANSKFSKEGRGKHGYN